MRRDLLPYYRSPGHLAPLEIAEVELETSEIREGKLRCSATGRTYPVQAGAAILIDEEDMTERRISDRDINELSDRRIEAEGGVSDAEGQRRASAYDYAMVVNTDPLFSGLEYEEGRTALEIGAGDTRLAAQFAQLGFTVFASDFMPYRLCTSADRRIPEVGHFERTACLMNRLPFGDQTFDLIYMHATLHHATPLKDADFAWFDPANMTDTLRELGRVLKPRPEGMFVLAGEGVYPEGIAERDRYWEQDAMKSSCYEHWYTMSEYESAFSAAGLWPNLWLNQEHLVLSGHGYSAEGDRHEVLAPEDGVTIDTLAWFASRARNLERLLPSWASRSGPEVSRTAAGR
jgi:SAM-dependent methyltransferase